MDKYFVGQEHAIVRGQEVGCMRVHGGQKNEVLVGDSSVGVDCGDKFVGGVEVDCSGKLPLDPDQVPESTIVASSLFFFPIPHMPP